MSAVINPATMQQPVTGSMERPENNFDFRNPDYTTIFRARAARLKRLRAMSPAELAAVRAYYKIHTADFINDWAVTVDPRVAAKGRSPIMPFLLFPKQREMVAYILRKWREEKDGLVEKSRDVGASWLFMATACTLALFHDDLSIGVGSYVEDKIDRTGDPDTLFFKARMYLTYLPSEFTGGWDIKKHSAHMRLQFPATRSTITGEAGDNIGRGGRKSIYGLDESAHLERPQLIDASLSANTNCRLDMSSVCGMANSFAEKRHGGSVEVFTFHWRDDPRKDDAWYNDFLSKHGPIVTAQEVDLNYAASVDMQIIPALWVNAAIDAHIKLKIDLTGKRTAALDVADSGIDKNAWGWRDGVILRDAHAWSGNDSDTHATADLAAARSEVAQVWEIIYDSVGVGAGIKGAGRKINEARTEEARRGGQKVPKLFQWSAYAGFDAVAFPEQKVLGDDGRELDRKNKEHYMNKAAQDWWHLRQRFQQTWRAVNGKPYAAGYLISIDSAMKDKARLLIELSQPQYEFNSAGKIKVVKTPDGTVSPNLADMARMLYCVRQQVMHVSQSMLDAI